jgi:hypothetical protein
VPCLTFSIIYNTINVIFFIVIHSYIYLNPYYYYIFIISVLYLDIRRGGRIVKAGLDKVLLLDLLPLF